MVDAVQALGAIRVPARDLGADILAAHGYKHLLSGYGVALCYCSPRARAELDITIPGLARHHVQCRSLGHARL